METPEEKFLTPENGIHWKVHKKNIPPTEYILADFSKVGCWLTQVFE